MKVNWEGATPAYTRPPLTAAKVLALRPAQDVEVDASDYERPARSDNPLHASIMEVPPPKAICAFPMSLILPYPPGVNSLYRALVRPMKGMRQKAPLAFICKTKECRDYMTEVASFIQAQNFRPWPESQLLEVTMRLYRPRKIGDIDGPIKVCFDAMNPTPKRRKAGAFGWVDELAGYKGVWADDSQVVRLHVERYDDKVRPRVEIVIAPHHA